MTIVDIPMVLLSLVLFAVIGMAHVSAELDEREGEPGEWGFRPVPGKTGVNPPNFSWRPQEDARTYTLQISADGGFGKIVYEADEIAFNVHTPTETLPAGGYYWRFRARMADADPTEWSIVREFSIPAETVEMPLPDKQTIMERIPTSHPRLFLRPEEVASLRSRKDSDLKAHYDALVEESNELLAEKLSTIEPSLYTDDMVRGSDAWREVWWGNRRFTQKVLNGAATLAFTWRLDGNEAYAAEARRILLECAAWDPKGATGYLYNDEAGMPYNYYFCRTYTFLYDFLTEEERDTCREVMKIRGDEMYDHLHPRHLWKPYGSHANRAWHFLGEIGITFLGEVDGAEDWIWFAMNVFANTYPVWNDDDGGWHEGTQYWNSYQQRFTWWADIMKAATGVNAFDKAYYSKVGYYPMYLQPPGTVGGGFGDLTASRKSQNNVDLVRILAAQSGNPYWQWYVDVHGVEDKPRGYVDFIRGALPQVKAKVPDDLPTSRLFRGVGQAYLNSNILDASSNVEIIFKSSPLGTQSHGYDSNNAFLLYAFGERLLIRTGRRDSYGSEHHKEWMWHTKSVNSITVNGEGQLKRSPAAIGEITAFHTSDRIDFVEGEAGRAYDGKLDRFTRRILFLKPDVVVVYDVVTATDPSSFEWRLHAPTEMAVDGQRINVVNGKAACEVDLLWPEDLSITQTDKFDTPPRPRIKLVEYHLISVPAEKAVSQTFVTVIRPYRSGESATASIESFEKLGKGYGLKLKTSAGSATVLMQNDAGQTLSWGDVTTQSAISAVVEADGSDPVRFDQD